MQLRSLSKEYAASLAGTLQFTPGAAYVYGQFDSLELGPTAYRSVLKGICLKSANYAFTREGEDEVISLMGYTPLWKGVAEYWVAQTMPGEAEGAKAHRSMLMQTLKLHEKMMDAWDLHRLSVSSPVNSPYHERMARVAKLAGFDYDGTMKRYTVTGQDVVIWSKTRSNDGQTISADSPVL